MKNLWRMATEVGFILFLFYSNLLMGEFEHSGMGQTKGLVWAMQDVVTASNLVIGLSAASIGYMIFEFIRKKFLASTPIS